MAVLKIVEYPDKRLRQRGVDVAAFDEHLHTFLDNMYETMMAYGGVGLAAQQVGVAKNVALVNIPREVELGLVSEIESIPEDAEVVGDKVIQHIQSKDDLFELVNPRITERSGSIVWTEGCLSIPGYYDEVTRSEFVTLSYQDRNGNPQTLNAQGFLAVAIQHELDHLNGVLFIDKLPILKRKKFEKEYKKGKK